jgi:hypothetical protein
VGAAEVILPTDDVPEDAADSVQTLLVEQLLESGKRIPLDLP